MGLNILVTDVNRKEHPDWDWIRQGHDEEFAELIVGLPCIYPQKYSTGDPYLDSDELMFRLQDWDVVRTLIDSQNWDNKERYYHLINLVEQDENYWIDLSR